VPDQAPARRSKASANANSCWNVHAEPIATLLERVMYFF
jgi:hypothetical protein